MANPRELKIVEALWQNAIQVIEADLFYVVLFNKVSVKLDFPLVAQKVENQWERLLQASREYRPDTWLPDAIFRDHHSVITGPNVENWPACKEKLISLTNRRPLSWLGVPMLVGNSVIGVVVVENYRREKAYDDRAQSLVRTMVDRVASALAQTRMIDNLRAVNKVGQALASGVRLQENEVLEHIFQQAHQLMNTDNMYIALFNAERQMLNFPLARKEGSPRQWPSRKINFKDPTKGGLTEIVLRTMQPLLVADVETYCREKDLTLPIPPIPKSWLGVPMISGNQALGIIALLNDEVENLYGPDDQEVLQTMAGQAAVAIENARLYNELADLNQTLAERVQARTKRISALLQVGQSLNSAIRLQQEEMLTKIADQISPLMDARNMYIALYDTERQELSFPLAREKGKTEKIPSREAELPDQSEDDFAKVIEFINNTEGGLTEIVLHQQKPLLIENVEVYCLEHKLTLPIDPMPKSWMGVPIIFEGKILGIISLRSHDFVDAYNYTDLEVLQTMAGQAAVALENARLYGELGQRNVELADLNENLEARVRERTKQLTALQDIGVKLASMTNLTEVLFAIVRYANEIMAADFCVLFPYDNKSHDFEKGIWVHDIEVELAVPTSSGLTASLAQKQEPYFAEDATKEPGKKPALPEGKEIRAFACIPLIARQNTVGVLYVNYLAPHRFSEEEREMIQLLCNQAAVAFENARLYQQLGTRLNITERQREALQHLVGLNDLAGRFVHKVSNLAGTVPITVDYIREELGSDQPDYEIVFKDLDEIKIQTQQLLDMARRIQQSVQKLKGPGATTSLQEVNAIDLIDKALAQTLISDQVIVQQPYKGSLELKDRLPIILTFETLFTEALTNLISNAVEAMPQGGILTLDIGIQRVADIENVVLRIADSGIGIPAQDLERIYDINYSKKPAGFGYGLWLVKQTCDATGAQVQVESEIGKGTTFSLSIPLAA